MTTPHTLTTESGPLTYHLLGAGVPRVALLPGWGLNVPFLHGTALWTLWQAWAERHPLLVLDRRGTGDSRANRGDVSPEQLAADLTATLDDAGAGPVTVWAHADAALAALPLAPAEAGARVERLVLQAPFARLLAAPDMPAGMALDAMLRLALLDPAAPVLNELDALGAQPDAEGDALTRLHATLAPGFLPRLLDNLASVDARPILPSVHVPVLILHGAEDRVIPPAAGAGLARLLPSARMETLAGMHHLPTPHQLAGLLARVEAFLSEQQ